MSSSFPQLLCMFKVSWGAFQIQYKYEEGVRKQSKGNIAIDELQVISDSTAVEVAANRLIQPSGKG